MKPKRSFNIVKKYKNAWIPIGEIAEWQGKDGKQPYLSIKLYGLSGIQTAVAYERKSKV